MIEVFADELADVLVLLSALATRFDIDLGEAVEHKFFEADGERAWATASIDRAARMAAEGGADADGT